MVWVWPVSGFASLVRDPAGIAARAAGIAAAAQRWWLHVDLDVLSTVALPAVDYPQDGGLDWAQLEAVTAAALAVPGCVGASLCIYNPDLDPDGRHARRIVSYAGSLAAGF